MTRGLFIGLATLDCIYLTKRLPASNEKIVALDGAIAAGGPAANAAVTFSYLGDRATYLGVLGSHPIAQLIRTDLESRGVKIVDLEGDRLQPPAVSSIIVTESTGERAVISVNATKSQIQEDRIPANILEDIDLVLIDGHQMAISQILARQAKTRQIPVVIDGGSWKPGFDRVLPFVDYAICSDAFYPPQCQTQSEVLSFLETFSIPYLAITQGDRPIQYVTPEKKGQLEIPAVPVVDTLGAGDVFHGAFCHYILQHDFLKSLEKSTQIAARSCQFFGTRHWMDR